VFTIFAALADAERTRINERIAEGKAAKRAKGGLTHRYPAYGYRRIGQGREAMMEIDPGEQQVIARIRQEFDQYGPSTLAARLTADGIMRRDGKPFTRGFVYELAQREIAQ
jgi:DNA invertase Pin-like site-specific DNA recombinase